MPLVPQDTDEYRKKEAEAERLAKDIEKDQTYLDRIAKEDGDEEEQFSAVIRPVADGPPLRNSGGGMGDSSSMHRQHPKRKPPGSLGPSGSGGGGGGNSSSGVGSSSGTGGPRKGPNSSPSSASMNMHPKYRNLQGT